MKKSCIGRSTRLVMCSVLCSHGRDGTPSAVRSIFDLLRLMSRKVHHATRARVDRDHCPGLDTFLEIEGRLGQGDEIIGPGEALLRPYVNYWAVTISSYGQLLQLF